MRVSVFGTGYVGTVTAACLARAGHQVIGVDRVDAKVQAINDGRSPVAEPGVSALIAEGIRLQRLRATTRVDEAVEGSEVALLCVGTPGKPNGEPDFGAIKNVAQAIGASLARGAPRAYLVVLRSTALPGTAETILLPAIQRGAGREIAGLRIAVNPEFMREASAIHDFTHPPFTLVGSNVSLAPLIRLLYSQVEAPIVETSLRTAEMIKYACNAFHALKICFANELADASAALGADAREVARVFLMDRQLNISPAYLRPGFAFGGSCLPKDLRALLHGAGSEGAHLPLLASILPANDWQIHRAVLAVLATLRRHVGIIGLTFKPGTDDLRESPLMRLAAQLDSAGCRVWAFDPSVSHGVRGALHQDARRGIVLCDDLNALLAQSEVLVLGHARKAAARARAAARADQIIIDLTRGQVDLFGAHERPEAESVALAGVGT